MLIDLSVPITRETPVYPGDPAIKITETATVAADGSQLHTLELGTHIGTHIDAPAHMIAGGDTLGQVPLDTFVGDAVCIDVTDGDISIAKLDAAGVTAGTMVLFNTGTHKRYYEPGYFKGFPVLPAVVVAHLITQQVKLVGLDTGSADHGDPSHPNHQQLLSAGIPIIENLTNLDDVTGKTFRLYALPLSVDLDGAPVRVLAEL